MPGFTQCEEEQPDCDVQIAPQRPVDTLIMPNVVPMVETLASSWLALQCQMIPKVHRGAVYLGVNDKENPTATACW